MIALSYEMWANFRPFSPHRLIAGLSLYVSILYDRPLPLLLEGRGEVYQKSQYLLYLWYKQRHVKR